MNSTRYLFSALFVAMSTTPVLACERSTERLLCAGDEVITPGAATGRILRQGPAGSVVKLSFDGRDQVYDPKALYPRFGCLRDVCVGERVAAASGHTGHIEGVNPSQKRVAVRLDTDRRIYLYDLEALAQMRGCAGGICVGDQVQTPDRYSGKVVAQAPYTGILIVNLDVNGVNYPHAARVLRIVRSSTTVSAADREASRSIRRLESGFFFRPSRDASPLLPVVVVTPPAAPAQPAPAPAPAVAPTPARPADRFSRVESPAVPRAEPVADAPLRALPVEEEDLIEPPVTERPSPTLRTGPVEPIRSTVPQPGGFESKARTTVPVWR